MNSFFSGLLDVLSAAAEASMRLSRRMTVAIDRSLAAGKPVAAETLRDWQRSVESLEDQLRSVCEERDALQSKLRGTIRSKRDSK